MSAMLLGAGYLGDIVFFWQVARGVRWSAVTVGFPAVTTFAALMGIATILHWDRFTQGSLAFSVWAILYFVTPLLVPLAWVRNRATDPGTQLGDLKISAIAKRLFLGSGGMTLLIGAALLLFPSLMASVWAWTLTPLTARRCCAVRIDGGRAVRDRHRWAFAGCQGIALESNGLARLRLAGDPDLLGSIHSWSRHGLDLPGRDDCGAGQYHLVLFRNASAHDG
jgi:hypothetical protein